MRRGSIIIELDATEEGARLLRRLIKSGDLTELCGYKILRIDSADAASDNYSREPIRLLFLAANPVNTARLGLDEEVREITAKIRASEHRERFHVTQRWAARPDDLLQALNEDKPNIVHFSGHGCQNGGLCFLDRNGKSKPVDRRAIRAVFNVFRDRVRVVMLNACYSEKQAKVLAELVDCTVGMSKSVGDSAAIVFAASFYRALCFGGTVQTAFDQGVAALLLEGFSPTDMAPRLHAKNGGTPTRLVGA